MKTTNLYKRHIKRLKLVSILVVFFISVSVGKTLYIQILHPQQKNIIQSREDVGPRGTIYDRSGIKLAYDIEMCDLFLNGLKDKNLKAVSSFMNKHFNISSNKFDSLLSFHSGSYFSLFKGVPINKIDLIRDDINELEDIRVSNKYVGRYYPKNNLSSQLIGSFSITDNKKGLWGIELLMNDSLKGKKGFLPFRVSSRGKVSPVYNIEEYRKLSGEDVWLTIDAKYQKILENELYNKLRLINAESANGIIINPYNGEVLALASIPNLNLNNQNPKNNDDYRDYSTFYDYEPGSTFKIFPILTGIENNIISLSDKYYCENGHYYIPYLDRTITDHIGQDTLSVSSILSVSSNIGIAKIASDIGKERIYNTIKNFGVGQKTGINWYHESSGNLKEVNHWDDYSLASISMGQELLSNNLQIAMAYSALANGGYLLKPKIVENAYNKEVSIVRKVSSPDAIDKLIEALKLVVSVGTASNYIEEYCMYGKTGTAEIYNKEDKAYSKSDYISTFAGVFPCEEPKLVCVVSFHKPSEAYKWAGLSAAPAVQSIFKRVFIEDRDLHVEIAHER